MAEDDLTRRANAYRSGEYTKAVNSRASARKTNINGTPANNGIGRLLADAPAFTKPVEQPKDFWGGLGEALDKPVIKQIIDGLSAPLYAVDNSLSNIQTRMQDASKAGQARGELGIGNLGNVAQTAWEGLNPGSAVQDIVSGIGKGLSAGVGNRDDVKTGRDLIESGQKFNNIDPTTEEARAIQGGLGFGLDVAMDPLGYVGAGKAVAAAKGARVGAKKFAEEAAIAKKEGKAISDTVESTKWQNAKREASAEVDKYKTRKLDEAQAKQLKRPMRKSGLDKVDYLIENVSTLRPGVLRALIKTEDDVTKVMDKIDAGAIPEAKLTELIDKLDPQTPDVKMPVIKTAEEAITTPSVGLAQFKAPTLDEKLFDGLGGLRTTNKVPRYSPETIKNVKEAFGAKAAAVSTKKVPDVKATIQAIKEFDKEMRLPGKDGKPGPGLTVPYKTADGKRYTLSATDLIDSLDPKDVKFLEAFNSLDPSFQKFKSGATASEKIISDENLMKLGVRAEDIPLLKQGQDLAEITDELSVGDIKSITRDIRNKEIPDQAIAHLHELANTAGDREALAKFIETNTATEGFKKAATQLARYGTHRTGDAPLPHLGVSGHGKSAIPGNGFTADDILAAKTPANPEQSQKFLEAVYNQTALELAAMPNGAELRNLADNLFQETIDVQRTPAGKLRTKRGASTAGPGTKAKFETKYNTHSAMHRVQATIDTLRKMPEYAKNKGKLDDAFMAVLKDIDQRLRLAGFDPHLSNMRIMGDKLSVRLGPSDVFSSLTKTQRLNWIHGNALPPSKVSSREILPTTVLDVAEVLVRSTTKLTPSGEIDMKNAFNEAIHTLQGTYSTLNKGKRDIQSNLDINVLIKNDQENLRNLVKEGVEEDFAKLHREAKTKAEKDMVVKVAREKHPEELAKVESRRLNEHALEVVLAFTKGFGDKPTILSDLINKNMRNASVFGGSVAKQVGEASAEYTRKVLDALDNGTSGDFLSELVTKPPFKISDTVANEVLRANQKVVQDSVATVAEMKHAKASAKKAGTKGNVEAYQKDVDLMEQVAKHPKEINTEILFDLAIRERNKDLLWRAYGFSRFFNKRSGMPLSFEAIANSSHAASLLMTGFHGIIGGWRARGITPENLRVALNAIKNDLPGDALSAELTQVMQGIFDPSKMNFLAKNSVGINHFNKVLKSVGFDEKKFFIPEGTPMEEIHNVWKGWEINHVEDFLSKMMRAVTQTAEDVSMGASFSKHFGQAEHAPGMVKIIDKSKDNPFFPLIDNELYYPKEIAEEMVHIGRLMTESRTFKPGTKLHTFVNKVMDPVINTLKMTQTTMKPGHHVMSVIGDGWRNHLALSSLGVSSGQLVRLYSESYRVLRSSVGDIEELSDFAKFERSASLTTNLKIGSTMEGGFEHYPNIGKGGKITHADIYKLMQAKGVALPAHLGGMTEDFANDLSAYGVGGTGSKIVNAIDKTADGVNRLLNPVKPKFGMSRPYSVNKFTANRDTWSRGVMFLGAMRSRKFASVDEAATYAAQFVHKWAPTAIDLGGFETKYARRMVFYYTWLRGMVPRIIEGALTNPGAALVPNKAMYNMGLANGLDLNSIGDPFPEGQLFPSWYSQKVLGPQYEAGGDLWGFNPTGPLGDVMNSLGSNIKPKDFLSPDAYTKAAGTFLNMSTPWFKAPLELSTGKNLASDAPIEDPVQYVQDMIGPVRTASRITGKDLYLAPGPDGLGMPNRTEKKFRNGMTEDQTLQNALPELLNWATGLQFTNYTSDSAQNSAFYQQKQQMVDQHKSDSRFR